MPHCLPTPLRPKVLHSIEEEGASCELQLIAIDGIYLDTAPRAVEHVVLTPAGRADVLVRCDHAGRYVLASGAAPGRSGVWNSDMYWNPVLANLVVANSDSAERTLTAVAVQQSPPPSPLPVFRVNRPFYAADLMKVSPEDVTNFAFSFQDVVLVGTFIWMSVIHWVIIYISKCTRFSSFLDFIYSSN